MTPGWAAELAAGGDADLVARVVRLAATPWVTPEKIRRIIDEKLDAPSVDAAAVCDGLESMAGGDRVLASPEVADRAGAALLDHGAVVRVVGGHGYPARLVDAWPELGAPLWVFVMAPGGLLPEGPSVAIVGTRHPTLDGSQTARELALIAARNGITVVSGMARGIDQAAHGGAIDGNGRTVAVLGTGFGVDYPRRDGPIRDAIAAAGGVVSELLPGVEPRKASFLWRNRIISALADATVVVEGRNGSGALQTARMAAAQGRDVLAVPGPVRAPTSRAPLDLIRDGAQPLTRLEDMLEVVGVRGKTTTGPQQTRLPVDLSPVAQQLLPLLGAVPAAPGTLAAATKEPVATVMAAIAELTSKGFAAAGPRGVVLAR